MAWGLSIQSFIRVIDSKGEESQINFNHPLNVDIGALKNTLRSTAALIDTIIRGKVIGAGIIMVVNLPGNLGLKTTAQIGSDIEEGVRLSFSTANGAQTTSRLPTLNETWYDGNGVLQVTSGSEIDDVIQRIIAGVSSGAGSNAFPSDAYGSDITAFVGGTESFVASRA